MFAREQSTVGPVKHSGLSYRLMPLVSEAQSNPVPAFKVMETLPTGAWQLPHEQMPLKIVQHACSIGIAGLAKFTTFSTALLPPTVTDRCTVSCITIPEDCPGQYHL